MYYDRNLSTGAGVRKNFLVWSFVLALIAAIAIGNVGQSAIETEGSKNIEAVEIDEKASEVEVASDGTISFLGFTKDTEIRDALRILAATTHKNIVPSSKVEGIVSVGTLYDISFEEALDAILGKNFEYEIKDNVIEVFTKQDVSRMTHRVFTLQFITAAEARKLIIPVLSDDGKVESTTAALTGVPTGESISSPTGGGDTMSVQDMIVVYDFAENIAKAEEVITAIDVRPQEVLIEATILSVTLNEEMKLGIDWKTIKNTTVIDSLSDVTRSNPEFYGSTGTGVIGETTGGIAVGILKGDVASFIRAVETVTDTTILANPKILAVNKQLGQVYIGKKIGYLSQTTQTGESTTSEVQFLDTGTKLSFRPYIGSGGYIRMDIHSKDSSGQLVGTDNLPEETSAELVTNIMVKDGGTIVIGGLFRDKITNSRTQIPILGDLPVIGALFRGTSDRVERQEVIILLTPHIIEEPEETKGQAYIEDIDRKRQGAHEEQQWFGRARMAKDHYSNAAREYLEGDKKSAMDELNKALELRPSYLEALQLKEKINRETKPDAEMKVEKRMLNIIENPEKTEVQAYPEETEVQAYPEETEVQAYLEETEVQAYLEATKGQAYLEETEEQAYLEAQAYLEDIGRKRQGVHEEQQWPGRARRMAKDHYSNAARDYLEGNKEAAIDELDKVLELRSSYLEVLRLKEKINRETEPETEMKVERRILNIIENPEETKGQAHIEDIGRKRQSTYEEQQWFGRAIMAKNHYSNAAKDYLEGNKEAAMDELNRALEIRPSYLKALQLQEKINRETEPDAETKKN